MSASPFNVLYVDHTNSARSIIAEALLNHKSGPGVTAFSAGDQPGDEINPVVVEYLVRAGIPISPLRPKSWDEFTRPGAPVMRCVITLWDDPAPPACPRWPGRPIAANWGVSDPLYLASIAVPDREVDRAFTGAFALLEERIDRLLELPLATLEPSELQKNLDRIGHS